MQESKGALKVWLALEKLYLTEEATSQRVRNTNDSNSVKKSESDSYDLWEKRQLKAVGKLRKDLLKTLQALQLHFDVKVSMAEDPDVDLEVPPGPASQEFAASFIEFIERVVIEPFGGRLYQPVHDIVSELDMPEKLLKKLKQKAHMQGASQRRNNRKPKTPSKVLKGTVGTPGSFKGTTV